MAEKETDGPFWQKRKQKLNSSTWGIFNIWKLKYLSYKTFEKWMQSRKYL